MGDLMKDTFRTDRLRCGIEALPLINGQTVRGIEGQSVVLPCSYKVRRSSDITTMCWGRGSCPNSKCNDVLIWTDGHRVTERSSIRYQLNDIIPRGQISLTINQASLADAGTYCCRIEHHGWFNDEKINIRLNMERAPTTTPPTTTPPTTTRRTTTPKTTRPVIKKTTPPPTTPKVITPPATFTTPLFITEIITTPPPTSTKTEPTDEEITTALIDERTRSSQPTPAESTVITTEPSLHTTTPYDKPMDELPATAQAPQPTSTDPCEICDFSDEASNHDHPRSTIPFQPATHPSENGNSDLFLGNVTSVVEKESGLPLHILITAICLSVIILIVVAVLILKFRGKDRGRYLFGLDPSLELVNHAEVHPSETDVEISQTVTLEVDKVDEGKPGL
ncbi:uncharacterized protein [Pyxicephalus adspersus]|uniref:uncharacterized protein isoform X2 n=1 Tax=Pyxicephalus adspersus TaxID=30357 RepID=UPI003B592536